MKGESKRLYGVINDMKEKPMTITHGTLYFSVSGEFIMNAARNFYYGEEKPEAALKILSCVRGLKVEDAYALLEGNAILTGVASEDEKICLVREPDTKYKSELAKLLKFRKERKVREEEDEEERRDTLNMVLEDYVRLAEAEDRKKSASTNRPVRNMEEQIAARKNDMLMRKFASFAGTRDTDKCAYYDPEAKAELRKMNFGEPYKMSWFDFRAGKPWIDRNMFGGSEEIEVIDFYCIPVRKSLLDEYVNHVIDRVRAIGRKEFTKREEDDIWMIRELEQTRRELHGRILAEAGLQPMEITPEANVFKAMVEIYLERKARTFGAID